MREAPFGRQIDYTTMILIGRKSRFRVSRKLQIAVLCFIIGGGVLLWYITSDWRRARAYHREKYIFMRLSELADKMIDQGGREIEHIDQVGFIASAQYLADFAKQNDPTVAPLLSCYSREIAYCRTEMATQPSDILFASESDFYFQGKRRRFQLRASGIVDIHDVDSGTSISFRAESHKP